MTAASLYMNSHLTMMTINIMVFVFFLCFLCFLSFFFFFLKRLLFNMVLHVGICWWPWDLLILQRNNAQESTQFRNNEATSDHHILESKHFIWTLL